MWQKLSRQLIRNVGTLVLAALLLFACNAGAAPQAAPLAQGTTTGLLSYQSYLTDAGYWAAFVVWGRGFDPVFVTGDGGKTGQSTVYYSEGWLRRERAVASK